MPSTTTDILLQQVDYGHHCLVIFYICLTIEGSDAAELKLELVSYMIWGWT